MNDDRIDDLTGKHAEYFGVPAEAVYSTAGRTELAGNHTDHNLGKVLAGSINLCIMAAVHKTSDNIIHFVSEGHKPVKVNLNNLDINENERGLSSSIVRGIAAYLVKKGGKVGGFCANSNSTVLKGSGLSSSASFEVMVGTILNNLYNEDRFSPVDLAIIGQKSENNYYGKPCGLMDQIACAHGGIVKIDFKDNENPIITPVSIDFAKYGYDYIVVNTGGSHADLTDDYAAIPGEMKSVARVFGKEVLREVPFDLFMSNIMEIRAKLGNDRAVLRAYHYFTENMRVDRLFEALGNENFDGYLEQVKESGQSSFRYLQNVYSCSNSKAQGISLAYALSENFLKDSGACRIQGGGFAGTVETYVPKEKTEEYIRMMEGVFGENCCTELRIRNTPTSRIR